jgi:hypothetical protein
MHNQLLFFRLASSSLSVNFITVPQIISRDEDKLKLGQHSTILEGHCAGGFVSVMAEFTLNEGEILRLRLRMTRGMDTPK